MVPVKRQSLEVPHRPESSHLQRTSLTKTSALQLLQLNPKNPRTLQITLNSSILLKLYDCMSEFLLKICVINIKLFANKLKTNKQLFTTKISTDLRLDAADRFEISLR